MRVLAILILTVLLASCSTRPTGRDALYQQLAGIQGIEAIVDQFCELGGGPCEYTGDTMAMSHRGMGITNADSDALVEDLIVTMEDTGTPTTAQNRLLRLLAPMHRDIMSVQDMEPVSEAQVSTQAAATSGNRP
jgi:hypothetical protein